ncbi:DUF397 domain-containing protein [Streptomyces sp. NPDC091292]|uniref:DUF397 domain-containing protein n=1 Tax=Streptomyces sp. NPDC091292 TaxID=3365991 RepID=UPI00382993BF
MRKPTSAQDRAQGAGRRNDAVWRKSSHSSPEGACVEIAEPADGQVLFRDSKNPRGPVMGVSRETAAAFTVAVRRGAL